MLDERDPRRLQDAEAPIGDSATSGFRAVLRALRPIVGQRAIDSAGQAMSLERMQRSDPPSVSACTPLEDPATRAVSPADAPGVRAFLDGIQRSRVVAHVNGSPLVHGTVAAAVRQRHGRVLDTWRAPHVGSALFAARPQLGEHAWTQLEGTGIELVDVCADNADELPPHPMAVRARALDLIALRRERAERQLAAAWCEAETDWLWMDGGVAGNVTSQQVAPVFGVVKSHNTLYGDTAAVRAALALRVCERSALFLVGRTPARAVASWYLRLRDASDGDPLHGLVRVELASPARLPDATISLGNRDALVQDAERISAWILAERAPLSLPDPRWDTLTYGIHACEMYLKAIVGG